MDDAADITNAAETPCSPIEEQPLVPIPVEASSAGVQHEPLIMMEYQLDCMTDDESSSSASEAESETEWWSSKSTSPDWMRVKVVDADEQQVSECRVPRKILALSPAIASRMQYTRAGKEIRRREISLGLDLGSLRGLILFYHADADMRAHLISAHPTWAAELGLASAGEEKVVSHRRKVRARKQAPSHTVPDLLANPSFLSSITRPIDGRREWYGESEGKRKRPSLVEIPHTRRRSSRINYGSCGITADE